MTEQVLIGKITSSHGVRGIVKVDLYIESAEVISNLIFVNDKNGDKLFNIQSLAKHKNLYLVKLDGVDDRNQSDALRGTELYIDAEELPDLEEDEFFVSELKDLKVKDSKGEDFGMVRNVFNFGAGDILEIIQDTGDYFMLTFTKENVPSVNIEEGFIVINESSAISNKGEIQCTK
jgi:16S rRNA processing protein RimM